MNKHISTYQRGESNPNNNNKGKGSYSHYEDNNYQKAVIEAFKLLSSQKRFKPHKQIEFDQELCKTLVIKWGLSCVDCGLPCEIHDMESMK